MRDPASPPCMQWKAEGPSLPTWTQSIYLCPSTSRNVNTQLAWLGLEGTCKWKWGDSSTPKLELYFYRICGGRDMSPPKSKSLTKVAIILQDYKGRALSEGAATSLGEKSIWEKEQKMDKKYVTMTRVTPRPVARVKSIPDNRDRFTLNQRQCVDCGGSVGGRMKWQRAIHSIQ